MTNRGPATITSLFSDKLNMHRILGPGPTTMPTTSLSSIVPSKNPSCSPSRPPSPAPSPVATQQPSIRSPSQSHPPSLKPTIAPSQFSVGGIAGLAMGCIFICALVLVVVVACRWYRKPAEKSEEHTSVITVGTGFDNISFSKVASSDQAPKLLSSENKSTTPLGLSLALKLNKTPTRPQLSWDVGVLLSQPVPLDGHLNGPPEREGAIRQSTPEQVEKANPGIIPTYGVDIPVFDKWISEKLNAITQDFSNTISSSESSPIPCARSRSMEEDYDASPNHVGGVNPSAANRPTKGYYRSRYVQAVLGPDGDIGWVV